MGNMYVVMSKLKDRIYPDNKHISNEKDCIIIICIMLFFGSNGTTEDT